MSLTSLPRLISAPAAVPQVFGRQSATVDDAPEVGFEQLAVVFLSVLRDIGEQANAGIVDPRINGAELGNTRLGGGSELFQIGDIGGRIHRLAASSFDLFVNRLKGLFIARDQNNLRAGRRRVLGGDAADAAGGTGDEEYLLRKRL